MDTSCLSDWEDEEEDITDGGGWDDVKHKWDQGSFIYVQSRPYPVDGTEDGGRGEEVKSLP